MRLLKVKHFRQRPSYCGPAALKILMSHYGVEAGEAELGRASGCTVKNGTEHDGLVKAAKTFGFLPMVKENATFRDLNYWINTKRQPVIVGWFSVYNGTAGDHYAVVKGLTKTHIILDDPEMDGPTHRLPWKLFNGAWFDFVGKRNERVSRGWMMSVHPTKQQASGT